MAHRVFARLIAIATLVASLLTPVAASASTYFWKVGGDGEWTNPNNWEFIPGTGNPGAGYPNGLGDQASFIDATTTTRLVTIPAGVTITVGVIVFGGGQVVIRAAADSARMVLDNGGLNTVQILRATANPLAPPDAVGVSAVLRGSLVVGVPVNQSIALFELGDDGAARSVTKTGAGELLLLSTITYGGPTIIADGVLRMESNFAMLGHVVIGDGIGAAGSARVLTVVANKIGDTSSIQVKSDGLLDLRGSDRMGDLTIARGTVAVHGGSTLTLHNLTMSDNGKLESHEGSRVTLEGAITIAGGASITAVSGTGGQLNLGTATRTVTVNGAPGQSGALGIGLPVVGTGAAGMIKDGPGALSFFGSGANTYPGETQVRNGLLFLDRTTVTIPGDLRIGFGPGPCGVATRRSETIANSARIIVGTSGLLSLQSGPEAISALMITNGGQVTVGDSAVAHLSVGELIIVGSEVRITRDSTLTLKGPVSAVSLATASARIVGEGRVAIGGGNQHNVTVDNGPQPIDLTVDVPIIGGGDDPVAILGAGVTVFTADNPYAGPTGIGDGTLFVNGRQPASDVIAFGGTLGGVGTVGGIVAGRATIVPTNGHLVSGSINLAPETRFQLELATVTPSGGQPTIRDRLDVHGEVKLRDATLALSLGSIGSMTSFTIIDNDGTDPIVGSFAGLSQGATLMLGGEPFNISYAGGDGNDVVVKKGAGPVPDPGPGPGPGPNPTDPVTYFLAEGATGSFFDDDVLIANPNQTDAPVTLTFLQEGGHTVVEHRTVAAQSRMTVHVDQLAGLESTSASVQVVSDNTLPLIVERSMFWDASYYGGHTANAVAKPETKWIFAEGFQGFFDTYILIANTNATATTATLTFLREADTPVVKTVPIEAFARKTVYAGEYPELADRAFGIVVEATQPVIAERSMYFASVPGRLWTGGHANTGIVAPSTSWFHAEGATGGFFSTFILLSNPQDTAAHVELRFLLDNGDVITRQKTIEARQRLTINPATEGDARLENAAVSTVVTSDVAIVSERSMYWPGDATPFGEGHNSSGVVNTGVRWGLAEGRIGGDHAFDTFILLANPSSQAAEVTITYLRESGAPIVKTYTVPATSRFNVDVKSVVPELIDSSFGARIEVTNNVPIAVERSLYWNANGVFWAGGSNALATPLP